MVLAKGVEPSLPREPDPKSGAVISNTYFPSKYAACFQFVPINLPTFSELPAQLPAQKSVRTGQTQTSRIRCSKLIPNRRRGGFPTPRAQFINNGFGLGEFLDKRGLNERPCLPCLNWAIFRDPPTKILPELDDSVIEPYGVETITNS